MRQIAAKDLAAVVGKKGLIETGDSKDRVFRLYHKEQTDRNLHEGLSRQVATSTKGCFTIVVGNGMTATGWLVAYSQTERS